MSDQQLGFPQNNIKHDQIWVQIQFLFQLHVVWIQCTGVIVYSGGVNLVSSCGSGQTFRSFNSRVNTNTNMCFKKPFHFLCLYR